MPPLPKAGFAVALSLERLNRVAATARWTLKSTPAITSGEILKGIYTDVTIQPAPGVGLTFDDLARHFLDALYVRDLRLIHNSEADSLASELEPTLHVFRVPAGELRIELGPRDAEGNQPVKSITVTDNLNRAWETAQTLRSWREESGS